MSDRCAACGMAGLLTFADDRLLCCAFCGCWSEVDRRTTAVYDATYIAERYERYTTTQAMSELRRRVMEAVIHLHETLPTRHVSPVRGTLLDVGFGDGSFIRHARLCGWDAFGFDVNPTEYDGVRREPLPIDEVLAPADRYRVITFFDSLEHFEDLTWAPRLARNTDWIVISLPRLPDQFPKCAWKHRRPGEHHFHFQDPESFETLFSDKSVRSTAVYFGNPEDAIRGSLPDGQPNIMTCVLRCHRPTDPIVAFSRNLWVTT